MTKEQTEKELELAVLSLKEMEATPPNTLDTGWMVNRRSNIYAIQAEIKRLRGML